MQVSRGLLGALIKNCRPQPCSSLLLTTSKHGTVGRRVRGGQGTCAVSVQMKSLHKAGEVESKTTSRTMTDLVLQPHLRKKRGKMGEGVRSYESRTTNGARSEHGGGRIERHQPGSRPAGRAVWSDRVTFSTCRGEKARWALLARAARAGGAQERLAYV